MTTIGAVANIFNEVNALPGWLEMAHGFFDHVAIYHAGPDGHLSDDGTMDILRTWKVPVKIGSINDGFGVVRTETIRLCPCEWVMILDADERFYSFVPNLRCVAIPEIPSMDRQTIQVYDDRTEGTCIPNWENAGVLDAGKAVVASLVDQGQMLRDVIKDKSLDAVVAIRRHWKDFSWKRPLQNWETNKDWQMRVLRNAPRIRFSGRMHEKVVGVNKYHEADDYGPFIEHHNIAFKAMQPEQRKMDIETYIRIFKDT